ncbi:glycosyltransferase [uncultured Ruegeria sp.]|uniref:glycosyltransferase n=1 Tax=uncultured Ruegeria sp. TaxID=259304 RepID=UPI00263803F7|nr:glycosyltransferase [uncultured Ruegeria sp.]
MHPANILILTYGTRGDVEPFVALALRLKERGHKATLATAEQFGPWIASFGLDYAPLTNASLDVVHSDDGKTMLEGGSSLLSRVAAGIRLARKSGLINARLCTDAWTAAQKTKPDLILYHPKVIAGPHMAEALSIPAMLAVLQPMIVPTSAFPATGLPRVPIPGYNRATYRLVAMSYGVFRQSVNRFRSEELGLAPVRRARDVLMPPGMSVFEVLHAISPLVVCQPGDWPAHALMTGYWWLPLDPDYKPPRALEEFLKVGKPSVYVGFGSMTTRDPEALGRLVLDAVRLAGVRGVIGSGWAGLAAESEDIIVIGDVPHNWLFPRMAAVVHHGGAGTTAAGFRAGVPSVICPFFGDQPGWAERSLALGVGAPPIPRKRLTPESLAASIATAICDPAIKVQAQHLATDLESEDGTAIAVSEIEKRLQACKRS